MNETLTQWFLTDADTWNTFRSLHSLPQASNDLPSVQIGDEAVVLVFEDTDLSGRDFTGYNLTGLTFMRCNLRNSLFHAGEFQRVYFEGCELTGSRFEDLTMSLTGLADCSLAETSFHRCTGAIMVFAPDALAKTTIADSSIEIVICDWKELDESCSRFALRPAQLQDAEIVPTGPLFAHGRVEPSR